MWVMAPISTSQWAPSTMRSSPILSTCSSQPRRPRYCIRCLEAASLPARAMLISAVKTPPARCAPLIGHTAVGSNCIQLYTAVKRGEGASATRPNADGIAPDEQDRDVEDAQAGCGHVGCIAQHLAQRIRLRQPARRDLGGTVRPG